MQSHFKKWCENSIKDALFNSIIYFWIDFTTFFAVHTSSMNIFFRWVESWCTQRSTFQNDKLSNAGFNGKVHFLSKCKNTESVPKVQQFGNAVIYLLVCMYLLIFYLYLYLYLFSTYILFSVYLKSKLLLLWVTDFSPQNAIRR